MDALDESWVERKLLTATNTQESVQSLSMWALHHKTQHERIVAIWFRVLKAAKLDLRLTLFYLCNEVVQTCRRKHAVVYKDAFKEVLRDAALLVRDLSIRTNIERIFKIWAERGVYDAEFVDELLILLNNTKVKTAMSTKLLADFTPTKLMDQLMSCTQLEEAVEEQRQALANVDIDALDIDGFKHQLKDRNQGIEYAEELEAACRQIKNYVNNLETEMKERAALVEMLEQSQLYYDAQSSEANMVAMAYKTFGSRVTGVKTKLAEHRAMLRSTMSSSSSVGSDENLNDGKNQYQLNSVEDDRTPYSDDGGGLSEDINSPLPYITPGDYFDEPLNDEDIFLFSNDPKPADVQRRISSSTEPTHISRRISSAELTNRLSPDTYELFPTSPVRVVSAELAHRLSPTEPVSAAYLKERSGRTSSSDHRMSPTERANLIFSRGSSVDKSRRVSSETSHAMQPTEPVHKRSRTEQHSTSVEAVPKPANAELFRRQSSNEGSRRLSSESETNRRRRYSYSTSSSSSSYSSTSLPALDVSPRRSPTRQSPPRHPPSHRSPPRRTRSKDSIGSDGYVQPALSFLPRNIASLGSQKPPPALTADLYKARSDINQGGATPTRDEEEGSSTPVLDEPDDDDVNSSTATKPASSYLQLQRQANLGGVSDQYLHNEKPKYSTSSDIDSDVTPAYNDKKRRNSQFAADVDKSRPVVVYAVDKCSSVGYAADTRDGFQRVPEQPYSAQEYYRPVEQEYHPSSVSVSVAGYHHSPARVPLSSSSSNTDVVYRQLETFQSAVDTPPAGVTYYPVVMETYPNSSYTEPQKPPIYQQQHPDFSVPPPAMFNPSLPPPNLSMSSISLAPQSLPPQSMPSAVLAPMQALAAPHQTGISYSLPPGTDNGTLGPQMNSPPPPRVIQITVLPGGVDSSLSVFSPPPLQTSSHLPPPTTHYSSQLVAPPRRTSHSDLAPPSGSFITTIGGNGDTRQHSFNATTDSTQPIRSITSRRDSAYLVNSGRGAHRNSSSPMCNFQSNKRQVLTSLSEEMFDAKTNSHIGVSDYNGSNQQTGMNMVDESALQIPTLAGSVSTSFPRQSVVIDHRSALDQGQQRIIGNQAPYSSGGVGSQGHFNPFDGGQQQPRPWF